MKVITLAEQKAGCGKSALAISYATLAARNAKRVLVLDADPQGTACQWRAGRDGSPPEVRSVRNMAEFESTPQGHWQVLTTLGAMSLRGIEAAMTIAAPTDGEVFRAYVAQVLCRTLMPGNVVVLDNLSAHQVTGIDELITACGAQLLYLPPYSPDLSPIEKAWSKFKQFLRAATARTAEALDQAITEALKTITPDDAAA